MYSPVYTDFCHLRRDDKMRRRNRKKRNAKGSEYPYSVVGGGIAGDAKITCIPISKAICNTKPETLFSSRFFSYLLSLTEH